MTVNQAFKVISECALKATQCSVCNNCQKLPTTLRLWWNNGPLALKFAGLAHRVISYHFSNKQHSFPGCDELFAGKNRLQDSLGRPVRAGSLDVPHCYEKKNSPRALGCSNYKYCRYFSAKIITRAHTHKHSNEIWGGVRLLWGGSGNNDKLGNAARAPEKKKRNICFLQMWNAMPPAAHNGGNIQLMMSQRKKIFIDIFFFSFPLQFRNLKQPHHA